MRSSQVSAFSSAHRVDGFSLVEVLIATGLLATAIAALAQVFAVATRSNVEARDTTYATVLAAQKLEELRAAPFPGPRVEESVDRVEAYTRRWMIEPLPADPVNAVIITVAVSRHARPGASGEVRLVTIQTRSSQ